ERHDVDAVLAERRADGGRGVRLPGRELQLHVARDFFHRSFLGPKPYRMPDGCTSSRWSTRGRKGRGFYGRNDVRQARGRETGPGPSVADVDQPFFVRFPDGRTRLALGGRGGGGGRGGLGAGLADLHARLVVLERHGRDRRRFGGRGLRVGRGGGG